MNESKGNAEGTFAFMCGKCFQVFPSVEEIESHECTDQKEQRGQIFETTENYITAEVVKLEPPYTSEENGGTLIVNEKGKLEYETIENIEEIARDFEMRNVPEDGDYEVTEDEGYRRKKKLSNNDYIMNKLVRDPYFKLDHNSYTFKDTLGDWDERSTKLLIILVGKYPKVHFLLQFYFERRLTHWENIHSCMLNAGYNFTVLQLRMRWREVFAKYRWTLNHNDLYENKKSFEYMKEMDELFGVWTPEATETLIDLVEYNYKDNPSSKHKRLGYLGWEKIATIMGRKDFNYSTLQVEARWRMLVTTYKSMIDHNIMPTVEPITAAYHERLSQLINYEPRRRKDYERYKGKKVKLEKFPESGMKHLIQLYKDNSGKFIDNSIKNSEVWELIRKSLESIGYCYTVPKIKEIFFATLKLYERILQHNSIPGAIKREGPHFKELTEIYDTYGHWPHVRRKRKTSYEKHHRKCTQKLRESMQTWPKEESSALLRIYPDVLESFMAQTTTSQQSDLWVQVAQAFQALGFSKKDTPEIATHIGLLRQGYNQGNKFPFVQQMQRVMEVEEALCYSPDVSKYTGDVEILYWSHDAIYLMLNLYLKIQPLLPYSSLSKEVYARISKEMLRYGYKYTCDQVKEEFRNLLFQFTMRRFKPEKASVDNWAKNKGITLYKEEMRQVMLLREKLSVGFTNGIKPIPDDVLEVIHRVAREKVEELFQGEISWEGQKERMKLVIFIVRRQIKKTVKRKPPVARKICVQLLSSLFNITETTEMVSEDLAALYCALQNYDYERILTEIMKETHNGSFKLPREVLDMERQTERICAKEEDGSEAVIPLCVLNVNEIKLEEDDFDCDNMSDEDDYDTFTVCSPVKEGKVCRVSVADVLAAEKNDRSLGIVVDDTEEFLEGHNSNNNFNKLVLINKSLGTKTTVLAQEDSQVTCISIDDLSIKQEPEDNDVDDDDDNESESVQLSGGGGDEDAEEAAKEFSEYEFDVVHSLNLSDGESPVVGTGRAKRRRRRRKSNPRTTPLADDEDEATKYHLALEESSSSSSYCHQIAEEDRGLDPRKKVSRRERNNRGEECGTTSSSTTLSLLRHQVEKSKRREELAAAKKGSRRVNINDLFIQINHPSA